MPASLASGRSPTPNKEASSDFTPTSDSDDRERILPVNPKVLRRATLKTDFYLIPIVGMFCKSPLLTSSSIIHLPFRSFIIPSECWTISNLMASTTAGVAVG